IVTGRFNKISAKPLLVGVILIVGLVAIAQALKLDHMANWVVNWKLDPGNQVRYTNAQMSFKLFADEPWFGVGVGGSGAYAVRHFPQTSFFQSWESVKGSELDLERIRNDVFAYSIPLEILAEWGLVGFMLWLGGTGFLLLRGPLLG